MSVVINALMMEVCERDDVLMMEMCLCVSVVIHVKMMEVCVCQW